MPLVTTCRHLHSERAPAEHGFAAPIWWGCWYALPQLHPPLGDQSPLPVQLPLHIREQRGAWGRPCLQVTAAVHAVLCSTDAQYPVLMHAALCTRDVQYPVLILVVWGFCPRAALLAGLQTDRADFHKKLRLVKTRFCYFFIYKHLDSWKNSDVWRVTALQSSSPPKSSQTHRLMHEHSAAIRGLCCRAALTPRSGERDCQEPFGTLDLFTSHRRPHGGYAQD